MFCAHTDSLKRMIKVVFTFYVEAVKFNFQGCLSMQVCYVDLTGVWNVIFDMFF